MKTANRFLLSVLLVAILGIIARGAATTETRTVWQNADGKNFSGWSDKLQLPTADLGAVEAGDMLVVSVSAINPETSWPQVHLRQYGGAAFSPAKSKSVKGLTAPCEVVFEIDETAAEAASTSGLSIAGIGFSTDMVTVRKAAPTEEPGEESAVRTVWSGSTPISWVSGSNSSVLVAAADLGTIAEGTIVRAYYKDMKPGGIGRMLANWTALDGQSNATLLGARYYEYVLSADNAEALTANGLRISGNNYTLTQVDVIDPTKKPLVTGEIDRADIKVWEKGESPKISVDLLNNEAEEAEVLVEVEVDRDCYEDYCEKSESVTLQGGETRRVTIPFDLEAGFYNLNVYVNGDNVCSYVIGCDPKGVVSAPDRNLEEIKAYWDNELEILKSVPMDAELTEIPSASTANRTVYLVRMKSTPDTYGGEPVEIRGFYAEPTGEGTYPALIQYQGTDGGTSKITPINGDDNIGWCELVISTRGQMLNNRAPEDCEWAWLDPAYDEDRAASGSTKIDYYAHGLNDREKHYYRGANIDCIRAIDFIASREKTNKENIFAVGGSQGGSFVYVAAALGGGRIRACAPSITGHSDFRDGAKIVNWPKSVFDAYLAANPTVTEEQLYDFLSLYDVMNLATFVECPVLTSFSLQDRTDPPHINVAPFNNISREKVGDENLKYVVNPFLGHGTAGDWKSRYMAFFNSYRNDLTPVDPNADLNLWKGECATGNWEGYRIIGADMFESVKAGDYLTVTVSETGEAPCLMLNNGSWSNLVDADAKIPSAGETVEFLITPDMLAELKSGGVVVKGCNFTFVSVDIRRGEEIKPEDPDAAVRRLWTGSKEIDWNNGGYVSVAAAKFKNVKAGETLRFVYVCTAPGAQGHLNCGWTAEGKEIELPGAAEYRQLGQTSYSVTVTEEMLAAINAGWLYVLGVGHVLTEVQAVDYSRLPDVEISFDRSCIRHFGADEKASLKVTVRNNGDEDADAELLLSLRHDNYREHADYGTVAKSVNVGAGATADVVFDLELEPGVYHFDISGNYREIAAANIACGLEQIESPTDSKADFEDFWSDAMAELAGVAPEYRMTKLDDYSTQERTVYIVEMKSVADKAGDSSAQGYVPVTIRGYYAEPNAAGKYKAVITYQGYDSNPETVQYIPHGSTHPDRIDFVLSTRGQGINNRGEYKAENEYYGDWFMYGFGDRESFYYRGAYMDAVRAFDFVSSREKTDRDNIFGEGHSQGGALTYAAAALTAMRRNTEQRQGAVSFNSIAPAIPFMGDFPDYFRIGAWPSTQAYSWLKSQNGVSEEDMYSFLSYFDTKNMAPYLDCHVISAVGLQDETCPPHTNVAPFNNINSQNGQLETALIVNPESGHEVHRTWNDDVEAFFDKHLKKQSTTGIEMPVADADGVSIRAEGRTITVSGNGCQAVRICDISGRTVYRGNGSVIRLNAAGIYIVEAGQTACKVLLK